jgi:hypothetical protein
VASLCPFTDHAQIRAGVPSSVKRSPTPPCSSLCAAHNPETVFTHLSSTSQDLETRAQLGISFRSPSRCSTAVPIAAASPSLPSRARARFCDTPASDKAPPLQPHHHITPPRRASSAAHCHQPAHRALSPASPCSQYRHLGRVGVLLLTFAGSSQGCLSLLLSAKEKNECC